MCAPSRLTHLNRLHLKSMVFTHAYYGYCSCSSGKRKSVESTASNRCRNQRSLLRQPERCKEIAESSARIGPVRTAPAGAQEVMQRRSNATVLLQQDTPRLSNVLKLSREHLSGRPGPDARDVQATTSGAQARPETLRAASAPAQPRRELPKAISLVRSAFGAALFHVQGSSPPIL